MKKIVSLLLSFCVLICGVFQSKSIKNVDASMGDVSYVVENIFLEYGMELGYVEETNTGLYISGFKIVPTNNIPDGDTLSGTHIEVDYVIIYHEESNIITITMDYNNGVEETIRIEPNFYSDVRSFDGTVIVTNANNVSQTIDIFDIDNILELEEGIEEEASTFALGTITICGIALWKIITAVVVAVVAVTMATYPEFYVQGIQSLCDVVDYFTSRVIEGVSYAFVKAEYAVFSLVESIRSQNDKNIYYIAIPITHTNQGIYGASAGDMLVSNYPVPYATAKRALTKGYSIYTFNQLDAQRVIRNAWRRGYAILEACDEGYQYGYYEHYHSYYKKAGVMHKRYITLNGIQESIHGFFGFPW